MQDRAFANPKIEFLWNHTVTDILGEHTVEGIEVTSTVDGIDLQAARHRLFVAIGHRPNTDLFAGVLDMDENGYLVTQPGSTYTNIDGRLRLRRRAGPHLPPGDHRRRHRLHGRHRRRTLARIPTRLVPFGLWLTAQPFAYAPEPTWCVGCRVLGARWVSRRSGAEAASSEACPIARNS